jgi:hypothetical protein
MGVTVNGRWRTSTWLREPVTTTLSRETFLKTAVSLTFSAKAMVLQKAASSVMIILFIY